MRNSSLAEAQAMVRSPSAPMVRLPNWNERLNGVLRDAQSKPYALGSHDCLRLACAVIEALTGADLWPHFAGRYATKLQALRCIAEFGGDFKSGAEMLFGGRVVPMDEAERGDLCEYVEAASGAHRAGLPHIGVVLGPKTVAVLGERGLEFLMRGQCAHCWKIG